VHQVSCTLGLDQTVARDFSMGMARLPSKGTNSPMPLAPRDVGRAGRSEAVAAGRDKLLLARYAAAPVKQRS
jgi:hypothetical protein